MMVGKKYPQPQCLCWLSGFRFSVGKRNPQIRADQIHHIQHVLDVSEAICLADDQLDLIVSCFNPCVAHPQPDGIQYVIPVTFDLEIQFLKSIDPAVACPPEPAFQF